MEKRKMTKLIGLVLSVVCLIGMGTWLLHIDKQKESMHEIQATQTVKAFEQTKSVETNNDIESLGGDIKGKLELNTATKEELATLPGIGPALAERIIEHRKKTPFKIVRDIKKVPGIGHKKYTGICEFVYVLGE